MKNPPFAYHRPESLDDALQLLADIGDEAKILAGGQSLLPVMAIRLSQPENIIDISRIAELGAIEAADGVVSIGATVTHTQAQESETLAAMVPLLVAATEHIGHRAIRNRGTVCGSLAHADPAAELPAVALALGAEVVVASSDGVRRIKAEDLFTGFLSTSIEENEMIIAVQFRQFPEGSASSVHELSRRHGDFALVGLACALDLTSAGVINDVALSFLGVAPTPHRAAQAEQLLIGQTPSLQLFDQAAAAVSSELTPPADNHASASYRKHGAGVLTKRALLDCANQIGIQL